MKFHLMQQPSVPDPDNKHFGYYTISCLSKYRGFCHSDEYGISDCLYINDNSKFAFIDDESIKNFKGETFYDSVKDIRFAIIKHSEA